MLSSAYSTEWGYIENQLSRSSTRPKQRTWKKRYPCRDPEASHTFILHEQHKIIYLSWNTLTMAGRKVKFHKKWGMPKFREVIMASSLQYCWEPLCLLSCTDEPPKICRKSALKHVQWIMICCSSPQIIFLQFNIWCFIYSCIQECNSNICNIQAPVALIA